MDESSGTVISGTQLRAARALLGWTATDTARRAKVTRKTIERLEQSAGVPQARVLTLEALQRAFEAAGVEFVGTPEEGPGVRLWSKRPRQSKKT